MPRLFMVILLVATSVPSHGDRDIVFSAQFYSWSGKYYRDEYDKKPEQTLDDAGSYHIYRINPDGSRLTQITHGKLDDRRPQWSADGRHIHFVRSSYYNSPLQIFRCDADGRRVVKVGQLHCKETSKLEWSSDERYVAALDGGLSLVRTADHSVRRIPNVTDFAWSPDGNRLFLVFGKVDRGCAILDVRTMQQKPTPTTLWNPMWYRADRIFGDLPPIRVTRTDPAYNDRTEEEIDSTATLDGDGKLISSARAKLFSGGDWRYDHMRDWKPLDKGGDVWAAQSIYGMSDGDHFRTYILNARTGAVREVGDRGLVAVSPDGRNILGAKRDWIGPYKKGGRRCGALEILRIATGRCKTLTNRLVSIHGGDWRRAPSGSSTTPSQVRRVR